MHPMSIHRLQQFFPRPYPFLVWQQLPLQITVLLHSGSLTFNLFSIRRKWQVTQAARCRKALCKNGHCSNWILSFCFRKSSGDMWRESLEKNQSINMHYLHHVVNFDLSRRKNWDSPDLERGCLRSAALLFKYVGLLDICSSASTAHPCHIPRSSTRQAPHCWHLQAYLRRSNCILYEESPFVSVFIRSTTKSANCIVIIQDNSFQTLGSGFFRWNLSAIFGLF